jgi:hypothetical protein
MEVGNASPSRGGCPVSDALVVLLTLAFFALSWLYVRACERV